MRKNIRRSFVVAAAASGIWALGTAGAGAAELPVSSDAVTGTVEKTGKGDPADELGDATRTVRKTTADVARCVTEKLPSKGIPENGLPTNTLPTGDLLKGDLPTDRVGGAVEDAAGRQGKVTGTTGYAAKAVKEARKDIRSATRELPATTAVGAVPGIEVPQVRPSSLPAPALTAVPQVPHLPTVPSAPATGDLVGGLAGASLRPEQLTGVLLADHAQRTLGRVRTAAATAQPFIDRANAAVLPPFAGELVVQVEVVADQGATDTAVTVDDAAATSAPFTESTSV
ncbi:MAG TPA: hypothetical protein VGO89_12460, partial [Streptomyces sp.]|nr:hypothetical protein [Streptomyces sp.]